MLVCLYICMYSCMHVRMHVRGYVWCRWNHVNMCMYVHSNVRMRVSLSLSVALTFCCSISLSLLSFPPSFSCARARLQVYFSRIQGSICGWWSFFGHRALDANHWSALIGLSLHSMIPQFGKSYGSFWNSKSLQRRQRGFCVLLFVFTSLALLLRPLRINK